MKRNTESSVSFEISGKTVTVYPCAASDAPIVYLNTYGGEGQRAYEALMETDCTEFNLVTVSGLEWNCDMTPWRAPSVFKDDDPFTGGAEEYLRLLTREIIPAAENTVHGSVPWRGLAGYSLAGLFAVYSVYKTDIFSRTASVSGSLWFPGFLEYARSGKILAKPDKMYFSLGDRECRTSNPQLRTIQDNTEALRDFYRSLQIETELQMNKGDHYKNSAKRTAAGIAYLIDN
ncbi:MAG: alpha/beta hydrolase-fold protein [Bacteroides sp.]|nr:alpha/beta hydrolase-fold protein [Bacteroides sp.]